MKVLILAPRLDVPFKDLGLVPEERGPIIPLRTHWANFVTSLQKRHLAAGDEVKVIEKPLWQFTPKDVDSKVDLAYVPHHDKSSFASVPGKTLYYMQTVFPWLFTVDAWGWGASMLFKIEPTFPPGIGYEKLIAWRDKGQSKFDQPQTSEAGRNALTLFDPEKTVFFPCQLPHDKTISLHSEVTVEDALVATCRFCKDNDLGLLVKAHPANPASCEPLLRAWNNEAPKKSIWFQEQNASIHDLIKHSKAIFTVNSGVGIEALLYGKAVYTFGRAEYSSVAYPVSPGNIGTIWNGPKHEAEKLKSWLETFYNICYDTESENEQGKV